ncbi:hypothetical protein GOP47_0023571 [Adiantum capillus-veneris]|uniref:F-box protein n=1 Tax=Adiantum capillus-veneris TaxID=13818 RepID=A0A9D4U6B1_ADICA|nr:hypothetical protein GOP47_0023571 [Adiantum capillus-veneris]
MENLYPQSPPAVNTHDNTQGALEALVDALLRTPDLSLQRSVLLGTHLQNAANRLWRQHDTSCNSANWPLTYDLTIKVFSQLGMHSLCQAAAACSLFNKVSMEPACYRDIDLRDRNLRVDNSTVAKLVKRAGQHLRSLKLGIPADHNKEIPAISSFDDAWRAVNGNVFLTKSCLEPLLVSGGAFGALLQTLHLQNIVELDSRSVCKVIAACPGLLDLEMIGLHVDERKVLRSVTMCCHKLTRLCLQSPKAEYSNSWVSYSMRTLSCNEIINGCPNIASLSLRGFKLPDQKVRLLLKGLHHLLDVDFSGADMLTGSFLRDLVSSGDQMLRSLKLCDCISLKAVEVNKLLCSLSIGECKNLRHLDVSNKDGLVSSDWIYSRSNLNEDTLQLVRLERPEIELRAYFSDEKSSSECDSLSLTSSFGYSEYTEPIRYSCHSEISLSENSQSMGSSSTIDTDTDQDSEDEDAEDNEDVDIDDDEDDEDDGDNNDDVEFDIDTASNSFVDHEDEDVEFLSPCHSSEGEDRSHHSPFGRLPSS